MELTVNRNLNKASLIISCPENVDSSDDSLQMVLLNQIPGLLPVETEAINGQLRLLYDISSLTAFSRIMESGSISREDLRKLVSCAGECMQKLREYLLAPQCLLLRGDCIFTDGKKNRFLFCFHPFFPDQQQKDLQGLFERLIACIDYEDQELVRMTYEMYMAVQNGNVKWQQIEEIIAGEKETQEILLRDFIDEKGQFRQADHYMEQEKQKTDESSTESPDFSMKERSLLRKEPDTKPQDFFPDHTMEESVPADFSGDSMRSSGSFLQKLKRYLKGKGIREVFEDMDDGVILQKIHSAGEEEVFQEPPHRFREEASACLISTDSSSREVIALTRTPFSIGKLSGSSDYILNSATVSRNHACIYRERDEENSSRYLIEDRKSRNGTYVNGVRLRPFSKTKIRDGDEIRLAERSFVFSAGR